MFSHTLLLVNRSIRTFDMVGLRLEDHFLSIAEDGLDFLERHTFGLGNEDDNPNDAYEGCADEDLGRVRQQNPSRSL